MSVAVCRTSPGTGFDSIMSLPPPPTTSWMQLVSPVTDTVEKPPGEPQLDIWNSIQEQKEKETAAAYVHPTMRRSSSLLSQKSLETCTENLGSESGSEDYYSDFPDSFTSEDEEEEYYKIPQSEHKSMRKEQVLVNYHCCVGRRVSPPRSFPPPLRSISSRDGPCLQMRPHRRDGRLVVEAVPVLSHNYLHAERHDGRLLLSFVNTTATTTNAIIQNQPTTEDFAAVELEEEAEEDQEQQQDDEEEVEVVDRGTVVEVKVSSQQPKQSKVHRSSIVINKFVSYNFDHKNEHNKKKITVQEHEEPAEEKSRPHSPVRRLSSTTAAAAVAASTLAATTDSGSSSSANKLLFTSRRRNREELLHDMRRCSQLRRPLFIWEPCYIAAST